MPNPYESYKATQITTAPPEKLVLMCYDGVIRFSQRAIESMEGRRMEEAHNHILRAQAIVVELQASLRLDAGEVARNLNRIYDFVHAHLVEANVKKDPRRLRDVVEIMWTLREGWAEACLRPAPSVGAAR